LIPGEANTKEYRERFLNELFSIWEDKSKLNALLDRAEAWARQQTWERRAKEWSDIFRS